MDELATWSAAKAVGVAALIFFGRADIETIECALPVGFEARHLAGADSQDPGAVGYRLGAAARFVGDLCRNGRHASHLPGFERLSGELPADRPISQRDDRIRKTGVDE